MIPARATAPTIAFDPDLSSFKPATEAASFAPEPPPEQFANPIVPSEPTTSHDQSVTAADLAIPVASAAALAATAGIMSASVPASSDEGVVTPNEPVGFTLPIPTNPVAAEPSSDLPNSELPNSELPSTGFAAELLARIQADDDNQQAN